MTDYSAIPNPGMVWVNRAITGIGVKLTTAVLAAGMIDWPSTVALSHYRGPVVIGGLVGTGAYLMIPQRKSPFEMAIAEFSDLGLSPEIIGAVIVENRAKAAMIRRMSNEQITNPAVQLELFRIADETDSLIAGFQDDPSDVSRSRSNMTRCLDQSIEIADN